MDAPNAPNPANPNAQDQFVDVVQSPEKSSSSSGRSKSSSRTCKFNLRFKGPVNNNAQVDQNIPTQLQQKPAPAQPVLVGLVAPAPQIIYQNWIGKKPEFSGKPEEDAESHLLSTRDWMEAHNFPDWRQG